LPEERHWEPLPEERHLERLPVELLLVEPESRQADWLVVLRWQQVPHWLIPLLLHLRRRPLLWWPHPLLFAPLTPEQQRTT
jgi:hypothetical protein